jgi:hypothetical protein
MTDLSPAAQAVLDAADIKNNGAVTTPGVNPWKELEEEIKANALPYPQCHQ